MDNKHAELKKLLKLAQKFRVKRLKVDNLEFEIELSPLKVDTKDTAETLPIMQPAKEIFPPNILFAATEDPEGDLAETAS
jgi:hypothetical protein